MAAAAPAGCQSAPTAAWTEPARPVVGAAVTEIATDAQFILSAQRPDGAIAWSLGSHTANPYEADYAAVGLAVAYRATGDQADAAGAWPWLTWYAAHEQPGTGYVSDYSLSGDAEVYAGRQDSTDAYAGTFLSAAYQTWCADPLRGRLAALRSGVTGAVRAIESTQQPDGLTWALSTYPVAYLMDNSEVYAGLADAVPLAWALGDAALAREAARDAKASLAGIRSLWDPAPHSFDWAEHSDGARQQTAWQDLYPDAMEQVWAVLDDAATPAHARRITGELNSHQPDWSDPTALARFRG